MNRVGSNDAFRPSYILLGLAFIVAFFLFALFSYLLYNYQAVLLSPSTAINNGLGSFLFWVFIIGILISLAIMAFVIYFFIKGSGNNYSSYSSIR